MGIERFASESRVEAPAVEVYEWHARPGAFERLTPPWERVEILERPSALAEGTRLVLRVRVGPLARRWVAVHSDVRPGRQFRDEQVEGPFRSWTHTHRFLPDGDAGCRVEDEIEFVLPFGSLGAALGRGFVLRKLRRMFGYRRGVLAGDLARHRGGGRGLRIAVTGSTGMVGTSFCHLMTAGGHEIRRVVRRRAGPDGDGILWDPARGTLDDQGLEDLDAVVHLAGENVGSGLWSRAKKARIRDSRVGGTRLLCETLARLRRPPGTLVCASATGFYGDRGTETVDETSPPGSGFLADVTRAWEAAAAPAVRAGIRVVHLRTGVVLSARGGALRKMLPPFRMGLGGRLGSGRQFMSWIALDDLIGAIRFAVVTPALSGPINATAPGAVTNAEFTRTLGRVLRRPAPFPVPGALLRAALRDMAVELFLSGARVRPRRLEEAGFRFHHPELEPALRFELGRLI